MYVFFNYVFLLIGAFILAGIGILISLLGQKSCLSKNCVEHAEFIHRSMNQNLDPCEDFYSFVCSKFPKFGSTITDEIEIKQLKVLIKYLEVPHDWEEDEKLCQVAKVLYQNCINDTQLDIEGLKPLQRLIYKIGGIPFLEPLWEEEKGDLFNFPTYEIKQYYVGLSSVFVNNKLIKIKSNPKLQKSQKIDYEEIVTYYYSQYSIPPYLYKAVAPDPEKLVQYCVEFNELYNLVSATNKTITDEEKEEIKKVAEFKSHLLQLVDRTKYCKQQPFETYSKPEASILRTVIGKMYEDRVRNFIVRDYSTIKTDPIKPLTARILIPSSFVEYVKGLTDLTNKVPDKVLANYMGIEALIQMTPFLPYRFREIYHKYLATDEENYNVVLKNRNYYCAKIIRDVLTSGLTAQYLQDNPEFLEKVPDIEDLKFIIKKQVKLMLKNIKWVSKNNRLKMQSLVEDLKIVSPLPNAIIEKLLVQPEMDMFFIYVCIIEESTLETYLAAKKSKMIKNLQLHEDMKVFNEDYDMFNVEIYYHEETNSIVVPFGYLNFPSVDQLWPKYLTFGGFAVWITSLILRIIGYYNIKYPAMTASTPPWWDVKTVSDYKENRQCVLNEYNQFLRPSKIECDDGDCLEDVLLNSAAIQAAYFSYHEYTKSRFFIEPKIPFMKMYTIEQIFFIKYASSFCQYDELGFERYKTHQDTANVPSNFTVWFSLRHFPMFSETFRCKESAKFSTKKPCIMWPLIKETDSSEN